VSGSRNPAMFFVDQDGPVRCEATRIAWEGPLCYAEWSNLNFHANELLENGYSPENLVKLTFRAIPATEDEYAIEAEITSPRARTARRDRVQSSQKNQRRRELNSKKMKNLGFSGLSTEGISSEDLEVLSLFDSLSVADRLKFWLEEIK
jgi:hypothetical protein